MGAGPEEGAAGPILNLLFRHALEVGKRARTETAIGRRTASVSPPRSPWPPSGSAAWRAPGCWCSAPARWARAWSAAGQAGVAEILVANRTWDRAAVALAERTGGAAVRLADLPPRSPRSTCC